MRYHQHLEASEKKPCSHGGDVFCTHLPLIEIDTQGAEIPGKAEDGADDIVCTVKMIDSEKTNNHKDGEASITSSAYIHVRGRSSRAFDKFGYALRLVDENGENNPQSVMGMARHHEWALHGPILDKTLIRNYMWYNIAGEIMDYAPNVRFCEAFLNGEYIGLYVMTETVTAGTRLNLAIGKMGGSYAGYLLRLDTGSKEDIKNIKPFSVYTHRFSGSVNIEYPGKENLTEEIADSICKDFSAFEKALYSFDYDDGKYGYKSLIDIDSFADYFILNEFALNYDAGELSTYIYKDLDGSFKMCVWDFNNSCDNYIEADLEPSGFKMQRGVWYDMLFKDEDFTERVISRYKKLRKTYLSDEYLNDYIDGVIDYLGGAVDRNFEKWGYTFEKEHDMLIPSERNPRTYGEAVAQLKTAISERGRWMDENIEALRQYSAESKVKKYNEAKGLLS